MARRSLAAAILVAALTLPAVPAMAGGGGGCHGRVTEGTGGTVEMIEACFTPTTLRVAPGETVTFVNLDPIAHNVGGNGWGSTGAGLEEDETFTTTFDEPGVHPYACTYHWGMTGAVVVGDGDDEGVSAASEPTEPSPMVQVRTVRAGAPASGWFLAGAAGLVLGLVLGLGVRALGRRRPAA
ncbi:MAG TPA: plastocyanin/azurin family copper-binding protein [Actinomycetota bacterium]